MNFKGFTTAFQMPCLAMRQVNVVTSGTPNTAVALAVSIGNTSLTRSGTTATYTANAAHHFIDGQEVEISGSNKAAYNGRFKITVTSGTVFTYVMLEDPGATSGGTPLATYTPQAQWALIKADSGNAADVTFGPDATCDFDAVPAAGVYELKGVVGAGSKFDLKQIYFKSASASQNIRILFM